MPAAQAQPPDPGDLAPGTHHPGHPRAGPLRQHTRSIPRHISAPNGPPPGVRVHGPGTGWLARPQRAERDSRTMAILPPPPTRVTIILARAQGGTLLRVRHTRFGHSPDWARARSWHKRAWITCLDNLEAFLAGRPPPGHGMGDLQATWLLRLTPRDRAPIAPARIEPPFWRILGIQRRSSKAAQKGNSAPSLVNAKCLPAVGRLSTA